MRAETVRLIGGFLLTVSVTLLVSGMIMMIGSLGQLLIKGTFVEAGILAGLTGFLLIGIGSIVPSSSV